MTIEAKIILDSVSPQGIRLTTMQLRYPKFIHAEFMTHRVFSRNARSSRAVPVEKILAEVRREPAMPVYWGQNQSGMQASKELPAGVQDICAGLWRRAANRVADIVEEFHAHDLHKQTANRILEPWTHIDVLVTSTEWRNFYGLRCHPTAQPEMRELAEKMLAAHKASEPTQQKVPTWHYPFLDLQAMSHVSDLNLKLPQDEYVAMGKISAARCARISYASFDSDKADPAKDLALADKLMESGHWSPFEHQALPDVANGFNDWCNGTEHRNFYGWRQFRAMIDTRISSTDPVIWEGR